MNDSPQTGAVVSHACDPARPTEAYVDADGFIIDADDEVVGHIPRTDMDEIRCDADADRVLEWRADVEANLVALQARRKAFLANSDALIARQTRRLAYWDRRFLSVLTAYARTRITERHRTAQFTWGRVSFRKTPPHSQIIDEAAAVAFVKAHAPELVKVTESVTVGAVRIALAAAEIAEGCGSLPFVVTSQPGESVTVSTGVEK